MKQDMKLKGRLKVYLQWPIVMIILLMAMDIWMFRVDKRTGVGMLICVLIYSVAVLSMYFHSKYAILSEMTAFAEQYGLVQNTLLKELPAPYLILMEDGKILWYNGKFQEMLGEGVQKEAYLSKYIPELHRGVFPKEEEKVSMEITFQECDYHVELCCAPMGGFLDEEQMRAIPEGERNLIAVHFQDVSELHRYIRENEEQSMVAGLIYIDNYDEVMDSVEEVRQSLLVALIDRKINQYVSGVNGIVKKLEKDKYLVVIKKVGYDKMLESKFALLEEVKNVNIGNQVPVTLSVGIGLGTESYATGYNYSRVAIDLALARGGDQVVIKSPEGIKYFGGKYEHTSKNTRVKARVKAEALREFMMSKEHVMVMGHKMTDVDSFGAAIGIYKAAESLGKKVNIVVNDISVSVRPFYDMFCNHSAYPEHLFLNSHEAEQLADENTMVIVVDTNRPKMTECEKLLKLTKTIAVLDHHRKGDDEIENAVLSYIEPYASSACEMVAEILQYIDGVKLKPMEANSMYAGIMIDTNNFMTRAGVRTFEAAAYLRRCGADITYVRKLLRDDMASHRAKAAIVGNAEVYHKVFAIGRAENLNIESPTIVGAQVANDLLNIDEIKASFVLTSYGNRIYVSARSIDEVNVQRMMEALGGGGHINAAGVQFEHTNMDEAVAALKMVIDEWIQKGEV